MTAMAGQRSVEVGGLNGSAPVAVAIPGAGDSFVQRLTRGARSAWDDLVETAPRALNPEVITRKIRHLPRRLGTLGRGELQPALPKPKPTLTVLIPAYNEAGSIADTIISLRRQTRKPDHVIVVDDCSKDGTGDIARSMDSAELRVTVVRPEQNRGCKASALNYGLQFVSDDITLAIDADTMLADDGIEKLMPALDDETVGAACGMVIPRHVKTMWERGRYIEYLYAFGFYKPIQDYFDKPLIASGCFAAYRTAWLKRVNGWPTRTVGEDMDLTWMVYIGGQKVRFVPEALCYPIEPTNFHFMRKQLTRWSHGFAQVVKTHWKNVLEIPYLRMIVAVALWDATFATVAYFLAIPMLALNVSPLFLLAYLLDLPAILVPVLAQAIPRGEVKQALSSIPSFYMLRFVNFYFVLKAFFCEFVINRRLKTFEKGH